MDQVVREIIEEGLVKPKDRCVLGLSGGPDSMALSLILLEVKKIIPLDLIFCHLHHGLRGKEADDDLAFVRDFSEKMKVPFVWGYVDMKGYAKETGLSPEEAGRILRHRFLKDQAGPRGKVALAHSFDDQAETILHRIVRGTGPDGLKGMAKMEGLLIRPLLGIKRKDLLAFLKERGQAYCIDSTNKDTFYTRNYIRHKALPSLKEINPRVKEALNRLGDLSRIDDAYFTKKVEMAYERMAKTYPHGLALGLKDLKGLDMALRYRLYRLLFDRLGASGLKNLGYDHLKILDTCLDLSSGKGLDLVGLRVERSFEDLIFYRPRPRPQGMDLKLGKNQGDLGQFTLYYTNEEGPKGLVLKTGEGLRIRSRKPGDRILMKGKHVKVKDLLQEDRVPRPFRDDVEILEGHVIYAVGRHKSDHWTQEADRLVVRKEKACDTN